MKCKNYIPAMENRAKEYVSIVSENLKNNHYENPEYVRHVLDGAVDMLNRLGFATCVDGKDSVVSFVRSSFGEEEV